MIPRSCLAASVPLMALFLSVSFLPAAAQQGQFWGSPGVVAVLTDIASGGTTVLQVNRDNKIDDEARILVKSPDGLKYEVHYVARIQGSYVYLDTPLKESYARGDLLVQGCDCDHAMNMPEDGMIGTLNEEVAARSSVLKYTPIFPLDTKAKLLIKRKDGSFEEVHGIKSYDGVRTIRLDGKLKHNFQPGDRLIQGCLVPKPGGGGFPLTKVLLGAAAGAAAIAVVSAVGGCDVCPQ